MATHSSILAWRIPWTKESGGLQSMGLQSRTRLSDSRTHTQLRQIIHLCLVHTLCATVSFSVKIE